MCIYCGTSRYRKIYEHHTGPIPKDNDGRTYEIHHIDGNHSNNDPINLKAVTIQEHYAIHHAQGDWSACVRIAAAMQMSSQELSDLARKATYKRLANGTHNFIGLAKKRVKDGTHNFIGANKGASHPAYDHTTYCFEHKETGKVVTSTRHDFYKQYSLRSSDVCQMLKGNAKSVKGWTLA
jgi:hypothetical protein